jgi:hypothetical protein
MDLISHNHNVWVSFPTTKMDGFNFLQPECMDIIAHKYYRRYGFNFPQPECMDLFDHSQTVWI